MVYTLKLHENEPPGAASSGLGLIHAESAAETIDAVESWASLEARIARIPHDALVRGMFFRALQDHHPGETDGHYLPFSNYPMREYARKLLATAHAVHPKLPAATALFKQGMSVFEVFASSLVGATLFGIANHDFRQVLELAPKGYALATSPCDLVITELTAGHAKLQLRNLWLFPDIFETGVLLGAMKANHCEGSVLVTRYSLSGADYELTWHHA